MMMKKNTEMKKKVRMTMAMKTMKMMTMIIWELEPRGALLMEMKVHPTKDRSELLYNKTAVIVSWYKVINNDNILCIH